MLCRSTFAASTLALVLCAACQTDALPEEATADVNAEQGERTAAPEEATVPELGKLRVDTLVEEAFALEGLSAEQRAELDRVQGVIEGGHPEKKAAFAAFRSALSDAVRTGTLDREAMDRHVEALVGHSTTMVERKVEAMRDVHALLTPVQRTALLARVAEAKSSGCSDKKSGDKKRGKFYSLVFDLDLTDAQRAELEAAKTELKSSRPSAEAKKEARRTRTAALVAAFNSNAFDAKTLAAESKRPAHMRKKLQRKLAFAEKAIQALTPEQRAALADALNAPRPSDS